MIQSLLLLHAPDTTAQATHHSPPAVARPVQPLKFSLSVLGNTIGFGAILATCWFSLQVMQAFIPA
jgi:hypothetical protein